MIFQRLAQTLKPYCLITDYKIALRISNKNLWPKLQNFILIKQPI